MFTSNFNPGNQGTIETTFTFPELTNLIQKKFIEMMPKLPIDAKPLFIYESIPQNTGNSRQFNEPDFTTYAADKPEGKAAQKGAYGVGYHTQMPSKRIALEYDITYEMRTQAQWYNIVSETVQALSQSAPQRINLDMTHRITFGNAVSYVDQDGVLVNITVGDGLALFSAVHTLAFSATTYSNIVPGNPQFSKTALESAELLTKNNILDNFGKLRRMRFTHIWCADTPSVTNLIAQYLRSVSDPVQANANVENPYKGKYQMLVLTNLATDANGNYDATKSLWWGLAALEGTRGDRWPAFYGEWEAPHMKPMPTGDFSSTNAEDVHTDNWTYGVRAGYGLTAVAGRGIIASLA